MTYRQKSDICDLVDMVYFGATIAEREEARANLKKECKRFNITEEQAYQMYERA